MSPRANFPAPLHAVGAEFASARDLFLAAEKIRDAGFTCWDVFSPFPVHGMDEAMGLGRPILGKFVFLAGCAGFVAATAMQLVPSSVLYPLDVSGKPSGFLSAPAFFPILFEFTILFSAVAAVLGMLLLTGLPRLHHPLFDWDRFRLASDDKFFAVIEARDPVFSEPAARELLTSAGGYNITAIRKERPAESLNSGTV